MIEPVKKHVVTSAYGWRILNGKRQFHDGIDFISSTGDRHVYSVGTGYVCYDQDWYDESLRWTDKRHSAGDMVIIKTRVGADEYFIRYLHLTENFVSQGQLINEGDHIGNYGDVGYSFGAHLHLDMYLAPSWEKIDPTNILKSILT